MTPADYRTSQSWKSAVDLGPGLAQLADDLPSAEEMGLNMVLRQLMVDLPAAVASDILFGSDNRKNALLKLQAALEMVDKVYPALDTAGTRKAADQLAVQLLGDNFEAGRDSRQVSDAAPAPRASELPEASAPAPVATAVVESQAEALAGVEEHEPETSHPVATPVEPTHVTVQAAAAEESEQSDVHPNSVE